MNTTLGQPLALAVDYAYCDTCEFCVYVVTDGVRIAVDAIGDPTAGRNTANGDIEISCPVEELGTIAVRLGMADWQPATAELREWLANDGVRIEA